MHPPAPGVVEDRLHRYLALILGALAGAVVLTREPSAPRSPGAGAAGAAARAPDGTDALSRPALDAAIAELARWIERSEGAPRTPLAANLRLLALGRPALDPGAAANPPSPLWQNLEALAALAAPSGARPASLEQPGSDPAERDAGAIATLAILLETGVPLDQQLRLTSGEVSVGRLLELTLPTLSARRESADPWALDLLSFAVLGGLSVRRDELERQTLSSLGRLEREQRRLTALQGDGRPAASALEPLVAELRERRPAMAVARELQLSAAVFRAVAVLGVPDLEQRALRHLNALLFRHRLERDAYQVLLERTPSPSERIDVHVDAIETLGRLEQALYGAHLAFRREDRPGPAPRTATSMRRAALDLLGHLQALRQSGAFDAVGPRREDVSRAAVQALRGLRAARIAT